VEKLGGSVVKSSRRAKTYTNHILAAARPPAILAIIAITLITGCLTTAPKDEKPQPGGPPGTENCCGEPKNREPEKELKVQVTGDPGTEFSGIAWQDSAKVVFKGRVPANYTFVGKTICVQFENLNGGKLSAAFSSKHGSFEGSSSTMTPKGIVWGKICGGGESGAGTNDPK
jgi:hypothetical protein